MVLPPSIVRITSKSAIGRDVKDEDTRDLVLCPVERGGCQEVRER